MRSAHHHLELVEAIEARDSEWAASVMKSHLVAAKWVFHNGREGSASVALAFSSEVVSSGK